MSIGSKFFGSLYSLCTLAFPATVRAQYREEMAQHFAAKREAAIQERGRLAGVRFSFAACADIIRSGLGERRRRRRLGLPGQRGRFFEAAFADLSHAARSLRRSPTFSLVCAVSLALGLAVVFTISLFLGNLNAVPAGVQADGLVEVVAEPRGPLRAAVGSWALETWSYPDYVDLEQAETGVDMAAWAVASGIARAADVAPFEVRTMFVSADYFEIIGVHALAGRIPTAEDRATGETPPIVISHGLWETYFDGDPNVLGTELFLNRRAFVVAAVAPEGFRGHLNRRGARQADLWTALEFHPAWDATRTRVDRSETWLRLTGRLHDDTAIADADGAVGGVSAQLAERDPAANENRLGRVLLYTSTGANQILEMSVIGAMFMAMAGAVLFVVCLNIAGMMLVRSATRARELAVRNALGASRWRLVRYLMAEASVLALAGGVLGMLATSAALNALVWWLGGPYPEEWVLGPSTLAACLGLALLTTMIFGLFPALRFSRGKVVMNAMKDDSGGGGHRVGRAHRLAAAVQAGFALPFIALGGLLFLSAREATTADLGFVSEGLYATELRFDAAGYSDPEAEAFLRVAHERLEATPGVAAAAVADGVPLDYVYRRARIRAAEDDTARARPQVTRVDANYFATTGSALRSGRGIDATDRFESERVAVLSESLAFRLFGDRSPLGERILTPLFGNEEIRLTVVGVAADVATSQLQTERHQMWLPLAQHPSRRAYLIARSDIDTPGMATVFDELVADIDPEFTRPTLVTGAQLVRDGVGDLMEQTTLSAAAAGIALVLSALGIYGVVAFMVSARTREMGVRIALGATRRQVFRVVLLDTCKLVVPGFVLGLWFAWVLVNQSGLLWSNPGAAEPAAYVVAIALALGVTLAASLPPANRAAGADPIEAIRAE